jgi:hypothetical protein
MTANRFASLIILALYLSGLAAWAGHYGVPAFIVGAFICVFSVLMCLTSDEGTPVFNFSLILLGGSSVYLVLGSAMAFLNLRGIFN